MITTACNLGTTGGEVATLTDVPVIVAETPALTATATLESTSIISAPTRVATTVADCTPRADWTFTYTVIAGDNLGSIARRASSSIAEIAAGNCLANPNNIVVGQVLRVPSAVATEVPTTATFRPPFPQNPPPQQGFITISSSISGDAGFVLLLRGDLITLRWEDAPTDAARVTFWLFPPGWTLDRAGGDAPPIGEDSNPADGAAIQWPVPGGLGEELVAFAYRADGTLLAYSFPQFVSSAPPAGQGCEVTAANASGITIYTQPDPQSVVFGTLEPGSYVEILGRTLNGWYGFDPGIAQAGNTGVDRLRWLPEASELATRGNCPA
jgi:LysM repeat protein